MTRKIAIATATATTINPADIATLFARAYMGEVTKQDDLKAAYEAAVTASRATQLINMVAIAKGKPAIDSEAFDADYKVAMRAALVASGKYTDGSVNTVYGRCRTAYLGMVNNIMRWREYRGLCRAHRRRTGYARYLQAQGRPCRRSARRHHESRRVAVSRASDD
jgi:hypothetical protein